MKHVFFVLLIVPLLCVAESPAELLWTNYYGGDYSDGIYTMLKTADDALLLGGFLKQEQAGTYDAYIVKTDSDGQVEWEIVHQGSYSERVKQLIATPDGNYLAMIVQDKWGTDMGETWLMKITPQGDIMWIQHYYGYYMAVDVTCADDDGYILLGNGDTYGVSQGFWLLRVDAQGDVVWDYQHPSPSPDFPVIEVTSIVNNAVGDDYFFCGYGYDASNTRSSFIAHVDAAGNVAVVSYGTSADQLCTIKTVKYDTELLVLAVAGEAIMIDRFNSTGMFIDSVPLQLDAPLRVVTDFTCLPQQQYLVIGSSEVNAGSNFQDAAVARCDSMGNLLWQQYYDYGVSEVPYALFVFDEMHFYTGGIYYAENHAYLSKFAFDSTSAGNGINEVKNCMISCYPNPFNPTTEIQFSLSSELNEQVTIEIFNTKGQKVKELKDDMSSRPNEKSGGISCSITWDGTDVHHNPVPSSVYLYQLKSRGKVLGMNRCLLLK